MFRTIATLCVAVGLSLSAVACGIDAADPGEAGEASQEVRGGPAYTLDTPEILGVYASPEGCPGGLVACERLEVRRNGDKIEVVFGEEQWGLETYVGQTWPQNGVIIFSTGDIYDQDCDDPGCGNMVKVTGVIYPVQNAEGTWVPQVKANFATEFLFPDEEGAPEGVITTTIRLRKE